MRNTLNLLLGKNTISIFGSDLKCIGHFILQLCYLRGGFAIDGDLGVFKVESPIKQARRKPSTPTVIT